MSDNNDTDTAKSTSDATVALIPEETWSIPLARTNSSSPFRLHIGFGIHFLVQFLNAAIRHARTEGLYLIYIVLLYGPVLHGIVLGHAWINQFVISQTTTGGASSTNNDDATPFARVLHLTGATQLPTTQSLQQERFLGYAGFLFHVLMIIVFLFLYGIFDKFEFDETFSNGVDMDELDSFAGMFANIFAQACWINVQLMAVQLLYPAVPSNAAALWRSSIGFFQHRPKILEYYTVVVGLVLIIVGLFEAIADDDTGVGIYMLCIYPVWFTQTIRRLWEGSVLAKKQMTVEEWKQHHPLWSRPCYGNSTAVDTTENSTTNNLDRVADDGSDENEPNNPADPETETI